MKKLQYTLIQALALLSLECLFNLILGYDIQTFIPGYNLDVKGLAISQTNQFFSLEQNQYVDCPANCGTCDDINSCTSCQYGYFQWSPIQNNNLYCVKCPLFDINDIENNILCGDCVTNPLTWQNTKVCSYKFKRIALNSGLVRYEYVSSRDDYKLYQIYSTDPAGANTQVIEFTGGFKWCGYELKQLIPPYGCNYIQNQNVVDTSQTAAYCRVGFVFNPSTYQCDACSSNCDECYSSQQCSKCSSGYTLGAKFKCTKCIDLIPDCLSCFFSDSSGNSLEQNKYLSDYFSDDQSLINSGFLMRCRSCSQNPTFLIPSLDLTKCEDCSSLTDCLGCRYASVNFGEIVDHSKNPFIVSQSEQPYYKQYCLLCSDPNFVNYNGICETCDLSDCQQCYYGTSSGSDSSYTLQNNFVYTSSQGNLIKKCAFCVDQAALMLDGNCYTGYSFLQQKDSMCQRWVQSKVLPLGSTLDGSYFKCTECSQGYGYDIGKIPENRICDKPPSLINMQQCLSYYYAIVNNSPQPVTCTRCWSGYTASAEKGCVSCSSQASTSANQYMQTITCTGCSYITSSGFNYTYYMMTNSLGNTAQKAIQVEQSYNLDKPFCSYCQSQKVYGVCQLLCFYGCLNEQDYYGCKMDFTTLDASCQACGYVTSVNWNLNQSISSDKSSCIQCPRYCQMCENRTNDEMNQINPYFITRGMTDYQKFQNQCTLCRTIADVCSDYYDQNTQLRGFQLDCSQQNNYIMYFDPKINQCTPCLKTQSSCNRALKIQQIIDCRPNISSNDINLGSDQNTYYQQKLGGGSGTLSHIFSGVSVIFLDNANPTNPLNVDFKNFNDDDYGNMLLYLALNEENISNIEFEVLFVPNVQNYQTNDGASKQNANVCIFPNDINFSLNMAQYLANINTLSLTFKTINPTSGQIGQDQVDFFITQLSFQGWNTFIFKNINFIPTYSIKPTVLLKNMLLDFSNNLFQSKLNMKSVSFTSGYDIAKQQKLLTSAKTIFCPIIDTNNFAYMELDNVIILNFVYETNLSFLKFNLYNAQSISIFKLVVNDLQINQCQFTNTNIFQLFYNTQSLQLKSVTIQNSILTKTIFINQLPGHNLAQSQQTIQANSLSFLNNQFTKTQVLNAYNLIQFKATGLSLQFKDNISQDSIISLFTSNTLNISQMQITNTIVPSKITFISLYIFGYPSSSPSSSAPSIIIDDLLISDISFSAVNGMIMNLTSYQNSYSVRGIVQLSNTRIINCVGYSTDNYLFYFNFMKQVTFNSVSVKDYQAVGFIFSQQTDQITLNKGSVKNTDYPTTCRMDPDLSQNIPQTSFHGSILNIKNLRTRLYVTNWDFEYQCILDRALFSFSHDQRDPSYLPETLNDDIAQFVTQNANQYDAYDPISHTQVVFNQCTFNKMNTYVVDSNIVSGLFYFHTNIRYRFLLVDVSAKNIRIYQQYNVQLFQQSSTFINQDSNTSSLILIRNTIVGCNSSPAIQNGILFNGQVFVTIGSTYDQANQGQKMTPFGYYGGFLNIQAKYVSIQDSKFSNSVSDQGGAIYIKVFSTSAQVNIQYCTFKDITTSFDSMSTGLGGAIFIDGTTSITLNVKSCNFDNIYAYKQSAVLGLTCGQATCTANFISNTISNVFAPSGSIINVKFNKLSQGLFFTSNTYTSTLTMTDMVSSYNNFQSVSQDILQSLQNFYIIYIQGGTIQLNSNTFNQVNYLQGLLYGTDGIVTFNQNTISDSNFRFTPFIYFYKQQVQGMSDITIQNMQECTDCSINNSELYFLTNFTLTSFSNFFLIENPQTILSIQNIQISKVICTNCLQGILGIQSSTKAVSIQTGNFKDNKSNIGVLFAGGNLPSSSSRILGAQQTLPGAQFNLIGVTFTGNTAVTGGGIYITYNNLQLVNCNIQSNTADSGGGIYFQASASLPNTLVLQQTNIMSNKAINGGGIKILGTFAQLQQNSVISGNIATQSGSDMTTYPVGLKVYQNRKSKPYDAAQKAVILDSWSPGVSLDQELFVYFTDKDGKVQTLETGSTATLKISLNYSPSSSAPSTAQINGASSISYDQIIGGFYLNQVQFSEQPLSKLYVKLSSSTILTPQYDVTGKLTGVDSSYYLPLIFNMRSCVVGESFIATSGQCFECANTTYSLLPNSTQCLECPKQGVKSCPGRNVLNLESGYWRPSKDSDQIEECSNSLSNCAGGKGVGDQLCLEGHIGALCEICDISARFWLESYSNSSEFSCGKCKNTSNNTLKIVGLTIYTLIAIFFSVKSTKALLDSYIITFYFQQIGFIQKSAQQSTESVGIIIKLFTTYLQLIAVITTFKLQLPPGISEITLNVGDPVQQMSFSLDCGLYKISGGIPMTYFRLIWSQLMPLFYVISYLIGHYLVQKIKKVKSRAVIAWIAFIYIYISMQPSIIKQNIQSLSCRSISGLLFIKSNVSEQCYTAEHIKYILVLILPSLGIWVFAIPLYLFKSMYKNRDQLNKISMQYKFGFLYTEYKKNSFFWELVKVYQKTFITFFINIYDSYNIIKGFFVIFVLFIYIKLQQKYQPYLEKRFNDLDLNLNLTVMASIIIAMFILSNPFAYLVWFGYIILFAINIMLVTKLIRILISGYTQKLEAKIGNKLISFSIRHPKLAKLFNMPIVPKDRVKHLWKVLKIYTKATVLKPNNVQNIDHAKKSIIQEEDLQSKNSLFSKAASNQMQQLNYQNNLQVQKIKINQKQNQNDFDSLNSINLPGNNQTQLDTQKLFSQQQNTPSLLPGTPQLLNEDEVVDDFNLEQKNEVQKVDNTLSQQQNGEQLVTQNEQKDFQIINLE